MANVIEIIFKATDNVTGSANKVQKSLGGLGKALAGLGAGFAAFTIARKFIQNTEAQQAAVAQLEATLKSTGGAAGRTSEQLQAQASALQRVTTFGDEAILSMQSVLATFVKINGTNFDDATKSILDYAAKMKIDLQSAAVQVGKALNDPILGISALGRAGVQFSEDQKKAIKALVDTGRTAEAQKIILKELENQFGGSARAARETLGGALKALENAFNDLFEGSKESTKGVVEQLNVLTDLLQDPATQAGAQALFGGIIKLATEATKKVFEFAGGIKVLSENLAARFGGAASDDIVRITDEIERLQNLRGIDFKDLLTNSEYLDRIRLFGDDGLISFWDDEELDAKIKELYAKLEAAQTASGQSVLQVETAGSSGGNNLSVIAEDELKKVNAAIQAGTSEYDKQKAALEGNIKVLTDYLNQSKGLTDEQLKSIGTTREEYNRVAEAIKNLRFELEELDSAQADFDILLRQDAARRKAMLTNAIPITAEIPKIEPPENLDNMMQTIYDSTDAAVEKMLELGTVGEQLAEGLHDAFVEFFMNMDKGFKGILQGFVKLVQRMIAEALAAMAVKALLGAFGFSTAASGGKIFGINKMPAQSRPVPGRASGGMVPVRVGEEGPEMAFLPVGTQIMNARQMAFNATGGGMGGGGFNYQPVYDIRIQSSGDPRDIENRLSMMLERRLAQHTNEIMTKMRNNGFGRLR